VHVVTYWLARLALMFAVFVALWGLGLTPWFAMLAAAIIAWLISYAMFGAMHDAAAQQMERWMSRRFVRAGADERAEDAEAQPHREPAADSTAELKVAPRAPLKPPSKSKAPRAARRPL
jgi:hypothetical protein